MDVLTQEVLMEKLTDLDKRKREAMAKKKQAGDALMLHQGYVRTAEERKKQLVEEDLVSDDPTTRDWAENEIEVVDNQIKLDKWRVESYTGAVAKAEAELAGVMAEWKRLDDAVVARERAEKFEAGKARIAARLADIAERLHALRLLLGDEVMDEFRFAEEFQAEGNRFLTFEREKFFHEAAVRDRFHEVFGWNGSQMQFLVKPMQRNSPPR